MKYFFLFCLSIIVFLTNAQKVESSVTPNVYVLDSLFDMHGLERIRGIRLYLPPSYESTDRSYPVIYMHDGQNLFDAATSFAGEWGVDEILNEIAEEGGPEFIVVGIDNGGEKRTEELTPYENPKYGGGKGKLYMDFIVKEVKPYIDTNYRTLKDAENTALMGSSLGGLITHYGIYEYPEVFSKAGIYSPSYWFSYSEMEALTKNQSIPSTHRLDLLVGRKEGEVMVEPLNRMVKVIKETGHSESALRSKVNELGEHNEKFWNGEFKSTILWLFDKN